MNCTVIQRRLLSAEQPDQPADEVKSHLAQCAVCRACQRRLLRIERQVALLPVPPSTAKNELLRQLLGTASGDAARPTLAEPSHFWRSSLALGPKERALRKLSLAFALAASLLIFALAWWSWPHNSDAPSSAVARRMADGEKLDRRLRKVLLAEKPKERVLQLARLAEELHEEAMKMVNDTEKLDQWARFYSLVVSKDLMEQARRLPPDERPAVLEKVASRLGTIESKASRRAAQLNPTDPESAASFDRIALAARRGEQRLRALMKV